VRRLDGMMIATRANGTPIFDDQRSFSLRLDSAEIALAPESVSRLLNAYLESRNASLRNINISLENGKIKQRGTLRKAGVPLPFSIASDVSADQGRMKLQPTSIKVLGIPVGKFLEIVGLELADLISAQKTPALSATGNDLLLSAGDLLPAPHIAGQLSRVVLESNRIVQVFGPAGSQADDRRAPEAEGNYMHYRGGTLQFGKLTMSDADLQLIDADPSDPFDFDPDRYIDQLVAGYSKNTRDGGLRVYMPDFDQVRGTDLRPDASARTAGRSAR
jgi:hypothetical protein